jgi:glutathione S-transferase
LVTFPPSLDSELARFLLDHHRVPYREDRHTLGFSSLVTLARAGTVRFPVVHGQGLRLYRVVDLAAHLERTAPPGRRLLPPGTDLDRARADWPLFHATLGTATTRLAYYHLLPLREVMTGPLSDGTPPLERAAVEHGYPAFAALLRLLLLLTAERERAARATLEAVMTAVDDRLADGRPHLLGDVLTLSDVVFAVAAAPAVWPEQYGGAVPPLELTPPALRDVVSRTRERASGAYALRVYRDHRSPAAGAI